FHVTGVQTCALPILPADVLSASNMSFSASPADGKYVLKSGDSMSGNLQMKDGADIEIKDAGELTVDGKTTLNSTLDVAQKTTCSGEVLVDNKFTVSGATVFNGAIVANLNSYFGGLLEAPGGATINDLEATGNSHLFGSVLLESQLDVKGDTLLESKLT